MGNNWQQGPFRIHTFKGWVPHNVRFAMLILFAFCFQLAGGVYLGSINQMVGGRSLLSEDVMMAAYSSFIGLTVTFPLVFRIKFRFKSRNIIATAALVIAACNIITMQSDNVAVLCVAGFVVGACRLIGTFECMSTLQGKLAPNHDQTIFFCVLFCIILSAIQLSGVATVYMDIFYNWEYMHLITAGTMLCVTLCAMTMMKDIRLGEMVPFKGIDWMGLLLWSLFLLSGVFTVMYGKHLDWFDSVYIRTGCTVCVVSLLLAIRQMHIAGQPYFSPELFRYKELWIGCGMVLAMVLLLATPKAIEGALMGSILKFDSSATMSVNWMVVAGGIAGSLNAFYWLARKRVRYKWIIFLGFSCIVAYQAIMYFIIDPRMTLQMFYIPSLLHGFGYTTLYVVLTLYTIRRIPFKYFLQPVGVLGFIRTGIGTATAAAIVTQLMTHFVTENSMVLGMGLDAANTATAQMPVTGLYGAVMQQALLVSLKQIAGWFTIGGIILLMLILTMPYIKTRRRWLPSIGSYRRMARRLNNKGELKTDKA